MSASEANKASSSDGPTAPAEDDAEQLIIDIDDVIEKILNAQQVDPAIYIIASELKVARDPTRVYQTPSASYEVRVRQLLDAALNLTQGDDRFNSAKQYIAEALSVCPPA